MTAMWLVAAVAALILAIALHAATSRLSATNSILRFVVIGCLTAVGLLPWLGWRYGWTVKTPAALLVYAFACELYIFLFTLAGFSISANLLVRLRQRAMTEQEIDEAYDSAQMIRMRLDRLLEKKLIVLDGEWIALTAKGRRLVAMFDRIRALFGHPI